MLIKVRVAQLAIIIILWYYGSMIDKSVLDKGVEYDGLPDVYIIYISKTDLWGGYKEMCEVAEKIYTQGMEQGIEQGMERGIEQGIERGIEQGIERGIEQGIEQGEIKEARKTAQRMYKSGYDVSTIAYLLGRAEKQVEAWLGLTLA